MLSLKVPEKFAHCTLFLNSLRMYVHGKCEVNPIINDTEQYVQGKINFVVCSSNRFVLVLLINSALFSIATHFRTPIKIIQGTNNKDLIYESNILPPVRCNKAFYWSCKKNVWPFRLGHQCSSFLTDASMIFKSVFLSAENILFFKYLLPYNFEILKKDVNACCKYIIYNFHPFWDILFSSIDPSTKHLWDSNATGEFF